MDAAMKQAIVLSVLLVSPSLGASDPQQATFRGTLLGHDGKPMKKAGVYVFYSDMWGALEWAEADAGGKFTLSTERTGVLLLRFAGVHHRPETVAVWVDGPEETALHVRLGTPNYPKDLGDLVLQSSTRSINQIPLRRVPDGSYVAEVETEEESVSYLISTTDWPTTWFPNETTSYASTGHYKAPISSQTRLRSGRLRIRFDPGSLLTSPLKAEIAFEESPEKAGFSSIVMGTIAREGQRRAIREEAYEAGRLPSDIKDDVAPSQDDIREAERRIEAESSALLRNALLMDYLHLTETGSGFNPRLTEEALSGLGPDSPLWWWQSRVNGWGLASRLGTAIGRTSRPSAHEGYLLRVVDALPTDDMKARIYSSLFGLLVAIEEGRFEYPLEADEESVRKLRLDSETLGRIAIDRFPEDRRVVRRVWPHFRSDSGLAPGMPVPRFSLPVVGGRERRLRDSSLEARVYVIEFWATWCAPCVEALPALGKLYAEYSERGFEILSYSFDDNETILENFRREKHPMPWIHAMDPERGFESDIAKAFGVWALPKSFLVDEDRKIVMVDPTVEEVRSYLEGALGK